MKKALLIAAAGLMTISAVAQPQLRKDNIDEVLNAMTLEEKATLLVGGSRATMAGGVTSGVTDLVPGAAGNTRARLSMPPASQLVLLWHPHGTLTSSRK